MLDRKKLRSKIPQGYCKTIATKAGVSLKTVSDYFSDKTK